MNDVVQFVLLAAASLAAMFVVVRLRDRHKQQQIEKVFARFVTPAAQATIEELEVDVGDHEHLLTTYWDDALRVRQDGDYDRAVLVLNEGIKLIQDAEPAHVAQLRDIALLARTIAFIVPLAPVRPFVFRSWRLRGLAGVAAALHVVLLTGSERIRLRLWMLLRAFQLTLRWLVRAGLDLQRHAPRSASETESAQAAWARVKDLIQDLIKSDGEAVRTAKQIILALDARDTLARERAAGAGG